MSPRSPSPPQLSQYPSVNRKTSTPPPPPPAQLSPQTPSQTLLTSQAAANLDLKDPILVPTAVKYESIACCNDSITDKREYIESACKFNTNNESISNAMGKSGSTGSTILTPPSEIAFENTTHKLVKLSALHTLSTSKSQDTGNALSSMQKSDIKDALHFLADNKSIHAYRRWSADLVLKRPRRRRSSSFESFTNIPLDAFERITNNGEDESGIE